LPYEVIHRNILDALLAFVSIESKWTWVHLFVLSVLKKGFPTFNGRRTLGKRKYWYDIFSYAYCSSTIRAAAITAQGLNIVANSFCVERSTHNDASNGKDDIRQPGEW